MPQLLASLAALFLTSVSVAQHAPGRDVAGQPDLDALLDGVREIAKTGVPGPLVVFGDDAFVVASARDGEQRVPLVAAARLGRGRVVVFGHTGYAGLDVLEKADTGRLIANAIAWAAGGKASPRVRRGELPARFDTCDVLVTNAWRGLDDARIAAVRDHVARDGGGLVVCGLGWGWQQLNPGKELATEHPWHPLLLSAGIAFEGGSARSIDPVAQPIDGDGLAALHAGRALARLVNGDTDPDACAAVVRAARALPQRDLAFCRELDEFVRARAVRPIVAKRPLVDPFERLVATVRHLRGEQGASPHAADFPGAVPPSSDRRGVRCSVDLSVPGWASTGRYAAPGEEILVTVPAEWRDRGLGVRIGCHTDRLWSKPKWRRFPEVSTQAPIRDVRTTLTSAFGGAVYVTVPRGLDDAVQVEIAGAVDAPWFVKDRTDLAEWRETIRHAPAPWAELQADKVVLSVPSEVVRDLDDPQELLEFWDRILDTYAELGARPLDARPQRIVTDRQISAGYMHSGYPIMMGLDVRETLVTIAAMKAARHGGVWGFWHELGHNHQRPEWTFRGTTEVTCNLFSLFVQERLSGTKPIESHRLVPLRGKVEEFLANGAPFEQWKKQPFLALYMYAQLQDAFGWEAFQRAFAGYREAPRSELPGDDDEKRDQWLVRMSRATGRDLGPFFERWGVPVSTAARAAVAPLPDWMPER